MKIGIDLGGSHVAIGVVDNNGVIIEKKERRILAKEKKDICTFIENYIVENVNELMKIHKISSIGIAIPGTINKTTIIKSVNLGIENYNIVERLKEKLTIPIKIKNDAKCAALAENQYGSLKNYTRSVFLTLGTGIGGAAIINNELLNTGDMSGMEVGHMVIEKNGLQCNCGNKGCFEKYASMKALKNNLRNELGLDDKVLLPGKQKDIFDKISDAKLFVLSSDYEGMPNALIEAMCLGLPVISTKVSGANELIEDGVNGYLIDSNIDQLTEKMIELLDNDKLRKQFGENAVKLNSELNVDSIVDKWMEIIEPIV